MRNVVMTDRFKSIILSVALVSLTSCKNDPAPSDQDAVNRYVNEKSTPSSPQLGTAPERPDVAPTPPVPPLSQRFTVTVVSAKGLVDLDDGPGVTDAYVVLEYDGERHQTSVRSDESPQWGDSFSFELRSGAPLRVTVMDEDALSDEKVGVTTLALPEIRRGDEKMLDVSFGGGDNGTVLLKLLGL